MKIKLLLILSIFIVSCDIGNNATNVITNNQDSVFANLVDRKFDSLMNQFSNTFNMGNQLSADSSSSFASAYCLKQRRFIPDLYGMTIDYRKFCQMNHINGVGVYHIYNDSIQFILPFIDSYYLNDTAHFAGAPPYTNLKNQFNDLFELLRIGRRVEMLALLDNLMDVMRLSKINDDLSFSIYLNKFNTFRRNGVYEESCKQEMNNAIKAVRFGFKNENNYIFSDGVIVYYLTTNDSKIVSIQVFGSKCFW